MRISLAFIAAGALASSCVEAPDGSIGTMEQAAVASQGSRLQGSRLQGSRLQGSRLQGSRLQGSRLQGMSLGGVALANVTLDGTRLSGWYGGKERTGAALAGATFDGLLDTGGTVKLRIASAALDTSETMFVRERDRPNDDVWLYRFQYEDLGRWYDLCEDDPRGTAIAGVWNDDGSFTSTPGVFTIACTAGVIAKCARWGYKPWKWAQSPSGQWVQLAELHQACTRAARADYCGEGTSFTRDGTRVDVSDTYGFVARVPESDPSEMFSSESTFDTGGAGCLEKTRYDQVAPSCRSTSLERLTPFLDDRIACTALAGLTGRRQLIRVDSGTYCSHATTVTGPALRKDCNLRTEQVCTKYPSCCGQGLLGLGLLSSGGWWDQRCVDASRDPVTSLLGGVTSLLD